MIDQLSSLRGEVVTSDDEQLLVSIDGVSEPAEWAMAAPCKLGPGQAVLCSRDQHGQLYVCAPIGRQRSWSVAADEIELQATTLRLTGDRLELHARRLFEKCVSAYRWTSDLLQWCCGRQRMLIDGQQQVRAGRIDQRATGDVRIDGEHINLG